MTSSLAGYMARNMAGAVFLVMELLQIVAGLFCEADILRNFSPRSHFSGYNFGNIFVYHPPNAVYGLPHPSVPHRHGEIISFLDTLS